MHRRTVLAGSATALAGCADVSETALSGPDVDKAESLIREAINETRATAGVVAVDASTTLAEAAARHSRDMAERDFYQHRNPDGEMPWHRVPCNASENIHRGDVGEMRNQGSDATWDTTNTEGLAGYVVEGWRQSQVHYQNLIDQSWRRVGVGVFVGDGEFFATAMFC